MPKQSGHRAGLPIERIVIDECLGPDSPLLAQLTGRLSGHPVELVFLAARHPGIPDGEILDKLLDGRHRHNRSRSCSATKSTSIARAHLTDAGYNVLTYDIRNHGNRGAANGGLSGIGQWE